MQFLKEKKCIQVSFLILLFYLVSMMFNFKFSGRINKKCYALVEEKIDLIMGKLKISHSADESTSVVQVSAVN